MSVANGALHKVGAIQASSAAVAAYGKEKEAVISHGSLLGGFLPGQYDGCI